MSEGKIIVGVDIGTSKIVTIIARVDEEFVNVLGVSEVPSRGVKKGQIVDIKEAVESINNSLDGAERMAGHSVGSVVASIGGSQIESQNSRGVVAVSSSAGEITESDLARVIDAAKAVSLPSSRQILHVLPRNYAVDGQEGIKDPLGMIGIRLEVDTHIISAASPSLSNLEKVFSQVGIDIDGVAFSGYASSLAVLSETEKELGVVLVDIGAGTTDISIYSEGSVAYSSVLAIGARHITNDLAIGLRISLESSEKIKIYLSNMSKRPKIERLGETFEREARNIDEIDLSSLGLTEDLRKVSHKTLTDGIVRPRLNEIFTMIGMEIKRSGYAGQTPAGIVITGGGALTVGAADSAKRTLAMPVRIGTPINIKGLIDEIQYPSFASVVGLAVFGATLDIKPSLPFGLSLPSFGNLGINRIFSKVFKFIKSFLP
ncbi:MAG: cell division protein FtsA [Candidatus Levybacteria bacterium RIFCSPLOWO2_01_FULL_39_24]|nr:MAG: cell division protein FtsA [Candidatus Levybacteria bacterium RIFCSPHIGHO2_01_FULL_40_16]OGH28719.1 MAG: cell division protein FtsA [Candidatus Levybacteria bacterium RIFCSPHIGHO2_12_FULL_39_9]OGH46168.1 MAG: cell division protein FtsA [Candidatus Levybacteria bacterium RIFCSPLOWO2_01_FULL_39_24]